MTLEEQIAVIEQLPTLERDGLSLVCVNRDSEVPKSILLQLQKKGLIVKNGSCYDVVSYWVHYAWCKWCGQNVKEDQDA